MRKTKIRWGYKFLKILNEIIIIVFIIIMKFDIFNEVHFLIK